MAPPYAIIFMGDLEEKLLKDCDKKYIAWWRYTDTFLIWQHGEKELEKFLEILNCYHPTIKFTGNYSWEQINFLDVSVRKKNKQLVTNLYIKPTDTHQYLHASSCHVYHSKKCATYSQASRLSTICPENSFYKKICNESRGTVKKTGGTVINWLDTKLLKPVKVRERTFLTM